MYDKTLKTQQGLETLNFLLYKCEYVKGNKLETEKSLRPILT